MVYLPFSSVYTRDGGVYAVQVPRDAQYVLEDDDYCKLDSKVGDLTVTYDGQEFLTVHAAKTHGKLATAYLCPHQGVAKGWPPCRDRKEPQQVTDALRTTARFLAKHIHSPYTDCLDLPPPTPL